MNDGLLFMNKLVCLWAAATLPAASQTSWTHADAVRIALESHPLLAVSAQRTQSAAGQRVQAGLAPNPKLILQSENTRPYAPFVFLRDTDNFAYLQNTFETANKRGLRTEAASANVRRTELETELLRRQIAGRVSVAYWSAAGARRLRELLIEDNATMGEVVGYHEVRVREGAMAEADLIRVRLEAQRLAVAVNQASLDAERGRINLQREMGAIEFPAVTIADPLEAELPAVESAAELAVSGRAELKLARAVLEQAEANQRLQIANARPNFDVVFGYKRTSGFDTMIGGLQVDLPFNNRNQGNIATSAAEIRLARSNVAATEALVRAEASFAETDFRMRRTQILESLRPTLDQAAETYKIAEAAYRVGGADLLRLLDARRLRTETQFAWVRALTELRQSYSVLRTAMGVDP